MYLDDERDAKRFLFVINFSKLFFCSFYYQIFFFRPRPNANRGATQNRNSHTFTHNQQQRRRWWYKHSCAILLNNFSFFSSFFLFSGEKHWPYLLNLLLSLDTGSESGFSALRILLRRLLRKTNWISWDWGLLSLSLSLSFWYFSNVAATEIFLFNLLSSWSRRILLAQEENFDGQKNYFFISKKKVFNFMSVAS